MDLTGSWSVRVRIVGRKDDVKAEQTTDSVTLTGVCPAIGPIASYE
jgi:hypothetical protein